MKRSQTAMAREVDGELVVLDIPSGRFFGLNDVGKLIWDRLEDSSSIEQLIDAVVADYEVDRDEASEDVNDLIGHLVDAGLVLP
jgi:hypothetical protein